MHNNQIVVKTQQFDFGHKKRTEINFLFSGNAVSAVKNVQKYEICSFYNQPFSRYFFLSVKPTPNIPIKIRTVMAANIHIDSAAKTEKATIMETARTASNRKISFDLGFSIAMYSFEIHSPPDYSTKVCFLIELLLYESETYCDIMIQLRKEKILTTKGKS